jgi:hypothetical protein
MRQNFSPAAAFSHESGRRRGKRLLISDFGLLIERAGDVYQHSSCSESAISIQQSAISNQRSAFNACQ